MTHGDGVGGSFSEYSDNEPPTPSPCVILCPVFIVCEDYLPLFYSFFHIDDTLVFGASEFKPEVLFIFIEFSVYKNIGKLKEFGKVFGVGSRAVIGQNSVSWNLFVSRNPVGSPDPGSCKEFLCEITAVDPDGFIRVKSFYLF